MENWSEKLKILSLTKKIAHNYQCNSSLFMYLPNIVIAFLLIVFVAGVVENVVFSLYG